MKLNKSIFKYIFILSVLVLFSSNIAFASSTYKVGEEIIFGRNYEFEEEVAGNIKISGAYNDTINLGNLEENQYEKNIMVRAAFVPEEIGVYRLDISVEASSQDGSDLSRKDTVYFVVTEDGRELTDQEISDYIRENSVDREGGELDNFEDRPFLKEINIVNAKLVEEISKERTEYNLKIDKNAQEIEFQILPDGDDTLIEGVYRVNPNEQNINIFSLTNDSASVLYTFRWDNPELHIFKYKDSSGNETELVYYFNEQSEYLGLEREDINILGDKYTVLKDKAGNLMIPLRELHSSEKADLYTFTTEGDILYKISNFINLDGETYSQTEYKKIFQEDLRLFNLEETEIRDLNSAMGYKINRTGYEGSYLVNLTRPDGYSSWYQFVESDKKLYPLDLPDNLFEDSLANFFGIDLNRDYDKFTYNYYDLALMGVAFISLSIIVFINIRNRIRNRKNKK